MIHDFENSIWQYYHESSKDKSKGHLPIPHNSNLWPESWTNVSYKNYPRLPRIALPKPADLMPTLSETMARRSSHRSFRSTPCDLHKLSTLLKHSCGLREDGPKRTYPSGGARYPIETYVLNFAPSLDMAAGIYHYDIVSHALSSLWERTFTYLEYERLFSYPWAKRATGAIILTAVFERTVEKYGERGYRYTMLEAGHIAQNLYLTSAAMGITCCAIGGVDENFAEELLDIGSSGDESILHTILFET